MKMGGSGLFFLKKWVGVGRFCQKMAGTGLCFLKNEWEWVRVDESG